AAAAFDQQWQQVARGGEVRDDVGIERIAQFARRLVEDAATFALGAQGGDDAVDRTVELADLARQGGRVVLVAGVRDEDGKVGVRMRSLQCAQPVAVGGDRDDGPTGFDGGADHAAADGTGRAENEESGLHRPAPGMVSPEYGTRFRANVWRCAAPAMARPRTSSGMPTRKASTHAISQVSAPPRAMDSRNATKPSNANAARAIGSSGRRARRAACGADMGGGSGRMGRTVRPWTPLD